MAERSNATSKKNRDAAQDVSTLQKRGRRRLAGAIALVLLAVIVLPMVFDPEPKPNNPTVSVRIPSEEGTKFTPKAPAKAVPVQPESAPAKAAEPPPVAKPPIPEPPPSKPVEKAAPPPAPKAAEKKATPSAAPPAADGGQFVFQVAAFANADKVKDVVDLLKEAKLAYYTETIATSTGPVTRVRVGPFASEAAAGKARERVAAMGRAKGLALNPASPVVK